MNKKIVSPCISICKSNPDTGYCYGCARSDEEKNEMRQNKDCLKIFRNKVIGSSLLNEKQLNDIDDRVLELIDNAVKFAREGAEPNLEDLTKDVYLSY